MADENGRTNTKQVAAIGRPAARHGTVADVHLAAPPPGTALLRTCVGRHGAAGWGGVPGGVAAWGGGMGRHATCGCAAWGAASARAGQGQAGS